MVKFLKACMLNYWVFWIFKQFGSVCTVYARCVMFLHTDKTRRYQNMLSFCLSINGLTLIYFSAQLRSLEMCTVFYQIFSVWHLTLSFLFSNWFWQYTYKKDFYILAHEIRLTSSLKTFILTFPLNRDVDIFPKLKHTLIYCCIKHIYVSHIITNIECISKINFDTSCKFALSIWDTFYNNKIDFDQQVFIVSYRTI